MSDLGAYRLRFTCEIPLDPEWAGPDEAAFARFALELLLCDPDEVTVATATVYRVRTTSDEHLVLAADAEPDSELLEEVCAHALEADGRPRPIIGAAFGEGVDPNSALVLDGLVFLDPAHDVPGVRGMLARAVLAHLGEPFCVLFLPPADAPLWGRAVGARRAGRFVVASADLVLPDFAAAGPTVGEA